MLASITSEVGTSGDTRSSICAVQRADGRFKLDKDATTGSYCAHADAIRRERAAEIDAGAITLGDQTMRFWFKTFGEKPQNGRSLWISMHGGGASPPEVI